MLTASPIKRANYYLRLASPKYYLGAGEPKGKWVTPEGHFGLDRKPVSCRQLKRILNGFSPLDENEKLVRNAGKSDRSKGWDLCFSAPKAVSVFFAACSKDDRQKLRRIQQRAVRVAMRYLEDEACFTRKGRGGERSEKATLIAASFEHCTSRLGDPQLHTHVLLQNVVKSVVDGKFGTLYSYVNGKETYNPILRHLKVAGALYRTELAYQLRKQMGLEIEAPKKGLFGFSLKGISQDAIEHYSKRAKEIEQELRRVGFKSSKAKQMATLATRRDKHQVNRPELFKKWQAELEKFGVTRDGLSELLDRAEKKANRELTKDAIEIASKKLVLQRSAFTKKDLVEATACITEHHGIRSNAVLGSIEREIEAGSLVTIGRDKFHNRVLSTPETLAMERVFMELLSKAKTSHRHQLSEKHVHTGIEKAKATQGYGLTEKQAKALRYLVTGKDDIGDSVGTVRNMIGDAGSGKTTLLRAAKHAFEAAGYQVVGASLAGVAADKLGTEADIKSATVAKWNLELEKSPTADFTKHTARMLVRTATDKLTWSHDSSFALSKKHVIFVDECGMADTESLLKLTKNAQKAGALLVYVGDNKQLQAVGHGSAFYQATTMLGATRLSENFRQRDPQDKEVVKLIAEGKPAEAMKNLVGRGRVSVEATEDKAIEELVRQWRRNGGALNPKDNLVICSTNEQRLKLNARLQATKLPVVRSAFESLVPTYIRNFEGQKLTVGDRVNFRAKLQFFSPDKSFLGFVKREAKRTLHPFIPQDFRHKREMIRPGAFATVLAINPLSYIRVAMDDGRVLDVPLKMERFGGRRWLPTPKPFRRKQKTPIALAYATTTHLAQGSSLENVYSLFGGSMVDRNLSYVAMSRARQATRVFTSEAEAGPELSILSQLAETKDEEVRSELEKELKALAEKDKCQQAELIRKMEPFKQKKFALHQTLER